MRIPALGLVAALAVAWTPPGAAASPPPTPTLTLDDLVALALATSPALRAADARADALAGAAEQADTLPNPEFGIQAENAAGSGPYRGAKALETTYSLTQTIEMGGKRGWRRDTAAAAAHRGALDRDAVRLDLARDVRLAAIAVLAAHERRQIVEEQRALADETRRAVAGRVQAGRDSPMREDRAGLALTQATVDAARARRDEDAAGHALSLLIDRPVAAAQLDTAALHLLAADGAAEAGGDVPDLAPLAGGTGPRPRRGGRGAGQGRAGR
ncbi:MAG: TolC family protein [Azospirillaceae bacterium]|nr:TolC family protein [Azospirillaceae bacterium]